MPDEGERVLAAGTAVIVDDEQPTIGQRQFVPGHCRSLAPRRCRSAHRTLEPAASKATLRTLAMVCGSLRIVRTTLPALRHAST